MSSCQGYGSCIQQCCCTCYEDEDHDIPSEICTCGHRNHTKLVGGKTECDMYCKTEECPYNCQLVECHNFRLCGKKYPQEILFVHNGMCSDCAIMIGKITFLDIQDECPICFETKDMIQVSCGKHKFCIDCWKQTSETENRPCPLTCPMCRESIWAWKGR